MKAWQIEIEEFAVEGRAPVALHAPQGPIPQNLGQGQKVTPVLKSDTKCYFLTPTLIPQSMGRF